MLAKKKAVAGDLLSVNIIQKSDKDSVMTNTYDAGLPQIPQLYPDSI